MNFFKKRKNIIIFGIIVASAFTIIIVLSSSGRESTIRLISAPFVKIQERNNPVGDVQVAAPTKTATVVEQISVVEKDEPVSPYPLLEITFTEEGFVPDEVTAHVGQVMRWVNSTENQILLEQLVDKHEEFNNGVTLQPGESFEITLRVNRVWTVREVNSQKQLRVYITTF